MSVDAGAPAPAGPLVLGPLAQPPSTLPIALSSWQGSRRRRHPLWRARAGSRRTVAGCRPPPVDADHDLEEILANNKRWVAATNAADPTFFPKLAEG